VIYYTSKHLEFCEKLSAARRIFVIFFLGDCDETLSLVFDQCIITIVDRGETIVLALSSLVSWSMNYSAGTRYIT